MKKDDSFEMNENLDDPIAQWFPPCYKCFSETKKFLVDNTISDEIINERKLQKDLNMRCFEDLGEIGSGSFSKIHKIRSKKSDKIYVAKLIDKKLLTYQNNVSKVQREIKVLFMQDHPGIIKLHYYFEEDKNIVLIMEYLESGSLFDLKTKVKSFDEKMTAKFMYQLLQILSYQENFSKDLKILHRDIKIENILIKRCKESGIRIILTDFGSCNFISPGKERRNTFCGTLEYLSPEMILNKGHSEKTDIWSAGIFMYELLVGKTPFRSSSNIEKNINAETCINILKKNLDLSEIDISDLCKDFILKILSKFDKKRWTVDQMLEHDWFKKKLKEKDIEKLSDYKVLPNFKTNDMLSNLGSQREVITNKKNFSVQLKNRPIDNLAITNKNQTAKKPKFNSIVAEPQFSNLKVCLHSDQKEKISCKKTDDTEGLDINRCYESHNDNQEYENIDKKLLNFCSISDFSSSNVNSPVANNRKSTKQQEKTNDNSTKKQSKSSKNSYLPKKSSNIMETKIQIESFQSITVYNKTLASKDLTPKNREDLEKINKERFTSALGKDLKVKGDNQKVSCLCHQTKKEEKDGNNQCVIF